MEMMLQTRNLTKKYGDFIALNEFSCDIPEGVTGLLGPNGAGKTTFIRSLLGIQGIEHGEVQFYDWILPKDITKARDFIGYQPEVETKIKSISAQRYVAHMSRMAGLPRQAANQRAFDTLHYVGLGEARYREMDKFSQGMLQKVKLATALVHDPKLLILDEPTAGCDPEAREQILSLIEDLGKIYGMNILISTHLLPDIERTANYVVVMSQGHQLIQGDLNAILKHGEDNPQFNVRVSGDHDRFAEVLRLNGFEILTKDQYKISCIPSNLDEDPAFAIFKLAKENGMYVLMVSPYRESLEEVFIDVVEGRKH